MDRIVSTKDLKSKLDRKQLTVVETLAPERYREGRLLTPLPSSYFLADCRATVDTTVAQCALVGA
jgi:hypothetical protein